MTTHVTPQPSPTALGAPHVRGEETPRALRASRTAWLGLAAVGLGAVLVFWIFDALPFQDLPAHAGLIALRHRFAESAFEQRYYVHAPHVGPYSLFRFLGELFVRPLGPVGAARALGTLPVIATPLALLFARRRLHGDVTPTYGYLGVALSFGLMTMLGFASYLLGVAVMLVGLTLWFELLVMVDENGTAQTRRSILVREITIAAFAPFMFVTHGHAFVLFLACAGVACLSAGHRRERLLRLRALVPAVGLAAWVAWRERGETPAGSVPVAPNLVPLFQSAWQKFELLVTPTLMTRSGVDFAVGLLVWGFGAAATIFTVRSLRALAAQSADAPVDTPIPVSSPHTRDAKHAKALFASASLVAVVFLVLPHAVGWFGFVDGRLVLVFLLLALLGIRRRALPRSLAVTMELGAPIIAAAVVALAMVASYRFQDEARGFREVLAHVPAQSRLLNLPVDPNSDVFTAHPFVHYDKLVLADRPVVVSDVWFHQGSALYPTAKNPALRLPASYSESDLKGVDWPGYTLDDWDYVLIRTRPNGAQPWTPPSLKLEDHRGGWWLFHR